MRILRVECQPESGRTTTSTGRSARTWSIETAHLDRRGDDARRGAAPPRVAVRQRHRGPRTVLRERAACSGSIISCQDVRCAARNLRRAPGRRDSSRSPRSPPASAPRRSRWRCATSSSTSRRRSIAIPDSSRGSRSAPAERPILPLGSRAARGAVPDLAGRARIRRSAPRCRAVAPRRPDRRPHRHRAAARGHAGLVRRCSASMPHFGHADLVAPDGRTAAVPSSATASGSACTTGGRTSWAGRSGSTRAAHHRRRHAPALLAFRHELADLDDARSPDART